MNNGNAEAILADLADDGYEAAAPFLDLILSAAERNAMSAEESFAETEFASKLLSLAEERCIPKDFRVFCSIVFQQEQLVDLAKKFHCSIEMIRNRHKRARRTIMCIFRDLLANRPPKPLKAPPVAKNKAPSQIAKPRSEKTFPQSTRAAEKPHTTAEHLAQRKASAERSHAARENVVKADCGCTFGDLARFLMLLIFFGGAWYLYDQVTPRTKGLIFERVIVESLAGSTFRGDIQSEMLIEAADGRHQVPIASVASLKTRFETGTSRRVKSRSDRLSVSVETTDGTHLTGSISRWIIARSGNSKKFLDLLAVKEIRSAPHCGSSNCDDKFAIKIDHLP